MTRLPWELQAGWICPTETGVFTIQLMPPGLAFMVRFLPWGHDQHVGDFSTLEEAMKAAEDFSESQE